MQFSYSISSLSHKGVSILEELKSVSSLVELICQQIGKSEAKAIPFRQYMELCLYAPEVGYYTSTRAKVGKGGDFYTSSAIGGLVGEMLASYIVKAMIKSPNEDYEIVEWGGGTGLLALQVLDKLLTDHPDFYHKLHFIEIEQSEYHRTIQKEKLVKHLDIMSFWSPQQWREQGKRSHTFIFSNELLDAFPVYRVRQSSGQLFEIYVAWDKDSGSFYECEQICKTEAVIHYLQKEEIHLQEGQTAEINLAANEWIKGISQWLEQGDLLTIDYGDISKEIYAPHRMNGTLLCYKDHKAHDNPYIHPGEQDITAHINFSACINSGLEGGIQHWKLQTQREFLVQEGILELLQNDHSRDPFGPIARRNRAIRQLLLGDQMAELFKVLHQTKN
jgi:SAM-dependent MidA family methyltransferase